MSNELPRHYQEKVGLGGEHMNSMFGAVRFKSNTAKMEDHSILNETNVNDTTFYEEENLMNCTAPPDLLGFATDLTEQAIRLDDRWLRSKVDNTVTSALASQDPCTMTDEEREQINRLKRKQEAYKTALCDTFRKSNCCPYGDECRFAHGHHELRAPTAPRGRQHPKYKTVLCEKYYSTGRCKYGSRCQFIHMNVNPAIKDQQEKLMNRSAYAGLGGGFAQNIGPDLRDYSPNFSFRMPPSNMNFGMMQSVDLNQSMPMTSSADVHRAFVRAAGSSTASRLAKTVEGRHAAWKRYD